MSLGRARPVARVWDCRSLSEPFECTVENIQLLTTRGIGSTFQIRLPPSVCRVSVHKGLVLGEL
jgi:hypothetical protein